MKWLCIILAVLFLTVLTVGCAELLGTPAPTPYPTDHLPTFIAMTATALQPLTAQSTPDPNAAARETDPATAALVSATPTWRHPSLTPALSDTATAALSAASPTTSRDTATPTRRSSQTPTPTPTPGIPEAAIQFSSPGPSSRVISPLTLVAAVHTVPRGSYHIELWAEPLQPGGEPRLLLRKVANIITNPAPWIYLNESLEFELSRVSELAELRILTYDQFGRPVSAASVGLILLQLGENQINPYGDSLEPLTIFEPRPNILIQGGTLIVTGMARPLDNQPLLVELVAANGSVAGVQQLFLPPDPSGGHLPFAIDVRYSVTSSTWVRLIISQSGTRIPGIRQLNSLEVLLSP